MLSTIAIVILGAVGVWQHFVIRSLERQHQEMEAWAMSATAATAAMGKVNEDAQKALQEHDADAATIHRHIVEDVQRLKRHGKECMKELLGYVNDK